jgi:hypothetical protein
MSRQDVKNLLGGPPGDYGPESVGHVRGIIAIPEFPETRKAWIAGHISISVVFDGDERVLSAEEDCTRLVAEESWLDRLRRWFGGR